ncbi:response regulator [Bradyrhizobium sp. McL0616]|uniref:response regulator n=1 Tax=Bradyrhizobium sp. McL0616 TaxID=3415674 RepID=UPI003CF7D8D1
MTKIRSAAPHSPEALDQQSGWPLRENEEMARFDATVIIRFGRFLVLPRARQLLVDGRPAVISSRAFDILMVLIRARGTLVTKTEIMNQVWPSTWVEESNLRVQMSALRAVLGEDREIIKTVPGRGYVFAVNVALVAGHPSLPTAVDFELPGTVLLPDHIGSTKLVTSRFKHAPAKARPTIIVIDDDDDVRDSLAAVLDSVGWRAELFASVPEFLKSDSPERAGCLVLDVRLPGQSGLDFHDELIKANVHLPVVFISGHADVPMSVRAMKAGAVEFLTKPIRHQDLLDAIQSAVGSSSSA